MKAVSNTKTESTVIKVKHTSLVLKNKHQLSTIIVDSRGRPDTLASNLYWDEFRSWHNHKKIYNKGNVVYSSRLKKKGISTSYKKLATKYNVSENTIRRKIVLLEGLGLISRDFETETKFKKVFHNQLIIHVWQQTPHFYNPMGVDREQIKELRLSTNHEYIESKYNKSSVLSNNDNKTPCNSSDSLACNGGEGIILREDTTYPHEVEIQSTSQVQLDKAVEVDSGILKNENSNIKAQNSSQSQLDKGVQDKGGIIIRDDRGIIVDEDTYILREELESLTESSLRSSFKNTPVIEVSNTEPHETKKTTEPNHTTCSNAILAEHSQVVTTKTSQPVTDCDNPDKPKLLTASEEKAIHQERMERTSENTGTSSFAQLMSKVLNEPEPPIAQEEMPAIKQEEHNLIPDKDTRRMLLSKAIFDAFGATANEIQDNCKFEETAIGKVTIKPAIGVSFNDIEKAKIRKCIKLVYGEDVLLALVNTTPYVSKEPVTSESWLARSEVLGTPSQNNSQWLNFKGNVRDRKVREILNNPTLKVIEIQGKVIIEGHAFLLEELFSSGYVEELEDAVVETGLTLEFHEKIVSRGYVTPDAKPTILCKEKIMKDREWRKNATDDLDNFINELKAK